MGRPAILEDIPDRALNEWARAGFDLVWFLGVWQTGSAGVSESNPEWLEEYHRVLPDFRPSDICGSCFAIQDYRVYDAWAYHVFGIQGAEHRAGSKDEDEHDEKTTGC